MNLVTITLIGCVIYFSEYNVTKKALMISIILVIVSLCLGVTEGYDGFNGCKKWCDKWHETKCNDCGILWGLGCWLEGCDKLKSGVMCDPKATPKQNCPDGKPCPNCGKPACPCSGPSPPPGKCQAALDKSPCVKGTGQSCLDCVTTHQDDMKTAGCTKSDFDAYCGKKPPTPAGDAFIVFENKTGSDIWIWFDQNPEGSGRIFSPNVVSHGSTTWSVQVPTGGNMIISSPGDIQQWKGGQCSVTSKKSLDVGSQNMNHAGLSSFEWTIDTAQKTVSANISNVSGLNVNGSMEITGITCDKNTSKTNVDLTACPSASPNFKIMTGGKNDVPSCSIQKKMVNKVAKDRTATSSDGNKCGDEGDCLGCAPLHDACDVPNMYKTPCYAKILQKKYGCLAWWTSNPLASQWKKYAESGGTDAYWWGMGEQILGGNHYDNSIKYGGTALKESDNAYKCISNATYAADNQGVNKPCHGRIMNNPKGGLRTCRIPPSGSGRFQIKFTIKEIMK